MAGFEVSTEVYVADNLDVLRRYVKSASVDLVYLDPPFSSKEEYNVLYKERDGKRAAAQVRAFEDTWRWDKASSRAYRMLVEAGGRLSKAMQAFRLLVGDSDILAYLSMMAPRLVELRRVLKPSGSIYLHCDSTASHYLKALMDAIFDPKNFRREIVWRTGWVSGGKSRTLNWVRNHDVLLYYVRDLDRPFTFNKKLAYRPHEKGYKRRGGGSNPKGVALDDVWNETALYSPWIKSFSKEKLGYKTQKPLALMERIVRISSRPGDVVLDPFCGGGTMLEAAQLQGRHWIGIDIARRAVGVIKQRLRKAFKEKVAFKVVGRNGRPGPP